MTFSNVAMPPRVVGLDLSLQHTGVCDDSGPWTISDEGLTGPARLSHLHDVVMAVVGGHDTALVTIEGYSYGSAQGACALGELGGVVRVALYELEIPFVDVPPGTLKKYATGSGTAKKVSMIIAARDRLGYEGLDDDQADAMWLWALGRELLGEPVVTLPATHLAALKKLQVPT